jgi:hypothetical protein
MRPRRFPTMGELEAQALQAITIEDCVNPLTVKEREQKVEMERNI